VVIDPGLAFGTGHHATTQGCLTLLERRVRDGGVRRALDLGTGSGILAIALAKLGVAEVWAVDTDADACRVARENCERNAVAERIRICDRLELAPGPFDLVAANLLGPQLIELSPVLAAVLAPCGHLIASGLLICEAPAVTAAFAAEHLVESERVQRSSVDTVGSPGDWVTLDLARSRR
jgi:ribosomal protein L11 methyltransferase